MSRLRFAPRTLALAGLLLALARPALAAPTAAERAEAADRFDRGLKLFNEGDNGGALAEFKRAYGLVPQPLILFNLALVYAELRRHVDAVDALEALLAAPADLGEARRERATLLLTEQLREVGVLRITTNVPAAIEVDGVEVARTPLERALHVARGNHVVAAVSKGSNPVRRPIDIAGGETQTLAFDLLPLDLPSAPRPTPPVVPTTLVSHPEPSAGIGRPVGWAVLSVGAGTALTGGVLALVRFSEWRGAHDELDEVTANNQRFSGRTCDASRAGIDAGACQRAYDTASSRADDADAKMTTALVVTGVGAVLAGVGAIVLVQTSPADGETVAARAPALQPVLWSTAGGGAFGVAGRF